MNYIRLLTVMFCYYKIDPFVSEFAVSTFPNMYWWYCNMPGNWSSPAPYFVHNCNIWLIFFSFFAVDVACIIWMVTLTFLIYWLWNLNVPENILFYIGTFKLTLQFSEDYPNKPPTVRFVSRMFHPNSKLDCWTRK